VRGLHNLGYSERYACELVGLNRSTYYKMRHRPPSDREIRQVVLSDLIYDIHRRSRGTYGILRVRAALEIEHGLIVNTKLVKKLMKRLGIQGLPGPRKGRANLVNVATCEDLVQRNFVASRPHELWLTDITEHPTRDGKLYCCCVLDMFTRCAVGWAMGRRATSDMVNAALLMAHEHRDAERTVIHSDHGSQGEFNRPSQHLDHGGVKWRRCGSVNVKSSSIEDRSHPRVVRRWPGAKIASGSGRQSPAEPRPKTPVRRPVCRARWGFAGSATLEG